MSLGDDVCVCLCIYFADFSFRFLKRSFECVDFLALTGFLVCLVFFILSLFHSESLTSLRGKEGNLNAKQNKEANSCFSFPQREDLFNQGEKETQI
mmetsp:Transcript_52112/g.59525  ORF Transcript_52112/g.59525 Transcript_52112/m.59525 type:complete len:96 (-) Transcript_52112:1316-1603(-)